jgi:hypothetical protein
MASVLGYSQGRQVQHLQHELPSFTHIVTSREFSFPLANQECIVNLLSLGLSNASEEQVYSAIWDMERQYIAPLTIRSRSAARHSSHVCQTQVTQYQVLHPGLLQVLQSTVGQAAYSGVDRRSRCSCRGVVSCTTHEDPQVESRRAACWATSMQAHHLHSRCRCRCTML